MNQMHPNDNESGDETRPAKSNPDHTNRIDASLKPINGSQPKAFTVTCDLCGGWTPVDEYEDEVKCSRCGSAIGPQSNIVVNYRPGMTPPVRWVGRVVLAVLALIAILAIWAVLFNRTS